MNTHKQNKSITIRLPEELMQLLFQQHNPRGLLTISQMIRQALLVSLPSNDEVYNGGE